MSTHRKSESNTLRLDPDRLMPGQVLRYEPGALGYRVYLTGGSHDANLWRFSKVAGRGHWPSLAEAKADAASVGLYVRPYSKNLHEIYA